jgi:hypothetical protein
MSKELQFIRTFGVGLSLATTTVAFAFEIQSLGQYLSVAFGPHPELMS